VVHVGVDLLDLDHILARCGVHGDEEGGDDRGQEGPDGDASQQGEDGQPAIAGGNRLLLSIPCNSRTPSICTLILTVGDGDEFDHPLGRG
jgi:hypothetical protein